MCTHACGLWLCSYPLLHIHWPVLMGNILCLFLFFFCSSVVVCRRRWCSLCGLIIPLFLYYTNLEYCSSSHPREVITHLHLHSKLSSPSHNPPQGQRFFQVDGLGVSGFGPLKMGPPTPPPPPRGGCPCFASFPGWRVFTRLVFRQTISLPET